MSSLLRNGVIDDVPCYLITRSDLPLVFALRSVLVFDLPVWVEYPGNEVLCITYSFGLNKFAVYPYKLRKC